MVTKGRISETFPLVKKTVYKILIIISSGSFCNIISSNTDYPSSIILPDFAAIFAPICKPEQILSHDPDHVTKGTFRDVQVNYREKV